jgi:hypothetical protein
MCVGGGAAIGVAEKKEESEPASATGAFRKNIYILRRGCVEEIAQTVGR